MGYIFFHTVLVFINAFFAYVNYTTEQYSLALLAAAVSGMSFGILLATLLKKGTKNEKLNHR